MEMNINMKIAFLGGDRRQLIAAKEFVGSFKQVTVYPSPSVCRGEKGIDLTDDLAQALKGSSVVALPLPASVDGVRLNAPLNRESSQIKLSAILPLLEPSALIIGGKIPESFVLLAESQGFSVFDYFESEAFQIKNAYTTAEAALGIGMNSLSKNIKGSRVAVTGFGRIAKHLCRLLLSMGAELTVVARKQADLVWAESLGCKTISLADGKGKIRSLNKGYDIIYNTIPNWIFDREFLLECDKDTLFVELASAPGGIDICAAKELGSNVSWAASLPGKYAPLSAGALVAECIGDIIKREVGGL